MTTAQLQSTMRGVVVGAIATAAAALLAVLLLRIYAQVVKS